MKSILVAVCMSVLALTGMGAGAYAAPEAQIQITIKDGCHLRFDDDKNTFSFGPFAFLERPMEQRGAFTITCSSNFGGKKILLGLDAGSANPVDRPMNRALYIDNDLQHRLLFQIYRGASADVWGNSLDAAYIVTLDSGGMAKNNPFVVQLLGNQDLKGFREGTYSNNLIVTINYNDIK